MLKGCPLKKSLIRYLDSELSFTVFGPVLRTHLFWTDSELSCWVYCIWTCFENPPVLNRLWAELLSLLYLDLFWEPTCFEQTLSWAAEFTVFGPVLRTHLFWTDSELSCWVYCIWTCFENPPVLNRLWAELLSLLYLDLFWEPTCFEQTLSWAAEFTVFGPVLRTHLFWTDCFSELSCWVYCIWTCFENPPVLNRLWAELLSLLYLDLFWEPTCFEQTLSWAAEFTVFGPVLNRLWAELLSLLYLDLFWEPTCFEQTLSWAAEFTVFGPVLRTHLFWTDSELSCWVYCIWTCFENPPVLNRLWAELLSLLYLDLFWEPTCFEQTLSWAAEFTVFGPVLRTHLFWTDSELSCWVYCIWTCFENPPVLNRLWAELLSLLYLDLFWEPTCFEQTLSWAAEFTVFGPVLRTHLFWTDSEPSCWVYCIWTCFENPPVLNRLWAELLSLLYLDLFWEPTCFEQTLSRAAEFTVFGPVLRTHLFWTDSELSCWVYCIWTCFENPPVLNRLWAELLSLLYLDLFWEPICFEQTLSWAAEFTVFGPVLRTHLFWTDSELSCWVYCIWTCFENPPVLNRLWAELLSLLYLDLFWEPTCFEQTLSWAAEFTVFGPVLRTHLFWTDSELSCWVYCIWTCFENPSVLNRLWAECAEFTVFGSVLWTHLFWTDSELSVLRSFRVRRRTNFAAVWNKKIHCKSC